MTTQTDTPATPTEPNVVGADSDQLQTLPLSEVEQRLTARRMASARPKRRSVWPVRAERDRRAEDEPAAEVPDLLLGPDPVDDRGRGDPVAAVGHWPDFGIILVLLVANAVVGFWEEHQAGNAIAALKAKLAINARVKRDGEWVTPSARDLVPGDVIRLRLGDIVPADARLLDGDEIEVDQSALTGESLPATWTPARRCSPARSSAKVRSAPWSTPPAATPTSARPPSWCRTSTPSATSRRRCSRSATT